MLPVIKTPVSAQQQHAGGTSAGAPGVTELAKGGKVPQPAPWIPTFFTAQEVELLKKLVDTIIPRTDTPGASDAGVHRIIDGAAFSNPRLQKSWRGGLAWIARTQPKGEDDYTAVLQRASEESGTPGSTFFTILKGAVVDAYYSTREGLQTELGWNANTFLAEFKGCTHPEHQA